MLAGANVLIVEDEVHVVLDLSAAVEEADGVVVGPAATTQEALMLIANAPGVGMPISAAVLGSDLADRDVIPVVLRLRESGIPMIVHSTVGLPAAVQALYPDIPWLPKPYESGRIVEALALAISSAPGAKHSSV